MKIRNIFMSLLAVLFVATGCVEEKIAQLDELQVSQSIVGFDAENPQAVEVVFTATADWKIAPAKGDELPSWFTVDPIQGAAGETTVTFTAKGADKIPHEADLIVTVGDKVQHMIVKQGVQSKEETPLAKISKEGVVGATYYVHATILKIENGKYGNLVLKDMIKGETGTLNVYGTLNDNGEEGHFADLGLGVGDEIWAHGPFEPYKGKPQLKNITVDRFKKALLEVDKTNVTLNAAGLEEYKEEGSEEVKTRPFTLAITVKGPSIKCELPEWISISGMNPGEGGATVYSFTAQPFEVEGEVREAEIVLTSGSSVVTVKVKQMGLPAAIQELTIDKFLEAEESETKEYKISGIIKEIKKAEYGNIVLQDGKAETYVHGVTKAKVDKNDKSFESLGLKVGDWVTIIGKRTSYNGAPQMGGAYHVSDVKVAPATFEEFLARDEVDHSTRSLLTGTVTKLQMENGAPKPYGNFTLVEEGTNKEIYVYGLVNAPSYYEKDGKIKFSNNKSFPTLGVKEGDKIQICSFLGSYNENKQAVESYIMPGTYTEVAPEPEPQPETGKLEGDGKSAATAYTAADLAKVFADTPKVTGVWVKGTIVGTVVSNKLNTDPAKHSESNLAIGTADAFVPVQLPSGEVRTALNLKAHLENMGKTVVLFGDIDKYFGMAGLKNTSKFELK